MSPGRSARRVVCFWVACLLGGQALADEVIYIAKGSTWRYFRGLSEASSPDRAAWRAKDFNDLSWDTGAAPFGYGDGPYGTNLGSLTPPMRNNYTTLFLRQEFQVSDPARVTSLDLNANYDDGFIAWVNGVEVLRVNVSGARGDPVASNGLAAGEHEAGTVTGFELPDRAGYLVTGKNVIAVQVLNAILSSADLTFEMELLDPEGPDTSPPEVVQLVPAPGTLARRLTRIEVTFDEDVSGVDAGDLLVQGSPASSLTGSARGPYIFGFPQPARGTVQVAWKAGHGIQDLATPSNLFGGGQWTVTLDPDAPLPDLEISELLAANGTGLKDEDGQQSDWIEIHNRGPLPVNLAGFSLTDDAEEPGKWTFPAVDLPAGGYLVVFASGKDQSPASGNLHSSFQLNAAGEHLALFDGESPRNALSAFTPAYPPQRTDHSYGVDAAGRAVYFETPTPGRANDAGTAFAGFASDPIFSTPRGLYQDPVMVHLASATPGAAIRYTLDGEEPTETVGADYTGPITLTPSPAKAVFTLRAAAFREGLLPSRTVTHTYLFPEHVPRQGKAPAGFPASWGNQNVTPADYEMDPRVVQSPAYSSLIHEGLLAIPSVSIVMSTDDLFGRTRGIYSNSSRTGVAWERPASAEIIDPGGGRSFQIDCGVRIQGGSSTENWKALKLSLRLLFKEDYGHAKLREPIYGSGRAQEFDSVVLDAGLNLTWNHPGHDQRVRSQYVRDQFVSDLQNAAGGLAPDGMLAHLYLNGLYWGVYNLHERPDASFAAAYLGGDKAEYDAIRHVGSGIVDGNGLAWNAMMRIARGAISTNAQYEAIQAYLDVPAFIDYMISNLYSGNDDWPRHNWYATRRRSPGGLFRFHSWDAEHVLKDVAINQIGVSEFDSPGELFSRLRSNAEFRLLFADRAHRMLAPGGILHVDAGSPAWDPDHPERNRPAASYMRRIREIDPAIVCEAARWGDVRRPRQPYTRDVEWQTELNWLLTQYFPKRTASVLGQFRAWRLYPAAGAPIFNQQGGVVPQGFLLSMAAPGGTTGLILYTLDGADPRSYGTGEPAPASRVYTAPILIADRTHVKARILSDSTWSALNEAIFTFNAPLEALRITEIMYHPSGGSDFEFLELQNTGTATLDLSGLRFTAGITFAFSPGEAIGPGEFMILVANPDAFAALYPDVPVAGGYSGSLDNAGERITLEDPRGGTVLSVDYNDERGWPIGPDGFGHSLVPADLDADPDDPRSWRSSARQGGSPLEEDPAPRHGAVLVSEVLARAAAPLEGAIELFNPASVPIGIGGWYLSDRRDDAASLKRFIIPPGTTIPAYGHLVSYEFQFNADPGSSSSFTLDERGGAVYLSAADGEGNLTGHIAGLEYGPSPGGVSFGTVDTSAGQDLAFLAFRTFGSDSPGSVSEFRQGRGAHNSAARQGEVVINEIRYEPPPGDAEFLELHNPGGTAVALHDAALGRGWQIDGLLNPERTGPYEFGPGASIPAGGYLLVVGMDPAVFRELYGIAAQVPVVGPPGGALDNGGERLTLRRPEPFPGGEVLHVLVDSLRYDDRAPWPDAPAGGEPTLERKRFWDHGNDPANWDASAAPGGTPGGRNTVSPPPGSNRPPVAYFSPSPASGPLPLKVSLDGSRSFDPDGALSSHAWNLGDGATREGPVVTHTYQEAGIYTVTLRVTDSQGNEASVSRTVKAAGASPAPNQLPGDITQDGRLRISDSIAILDHLFGASPPALPCGDGTWRDASNQALLDANGQSGVDLADAVHLLFRLLAGGPPHVLGEACVRLEGCPRACP